MKLKSWIIDGVGEEIELYRRLQRANIIIFIDLPIEEHLRLAKQKEKTPTETSPPGCSYEDMFDTIAGIIRHLDTTLIPQLRSDIPKIAKHTNATVYKVTQIDELAYLLKILVTNNEPSP